MNYAHFSMKISGRDLRDLFARRCEEIEGDLRRYLAERLEREANPPKNDECDTPFAVAAVDHFPIDRVKRDVERQVTAMKKIADLLDGAFHYDMTVSDLVALGLLPNMQPFSRITDTL